MEPSNINLTSNSGNVVTPSPSTPPKKTWGDRAWVWIKDNIPLVARIASAVSKIFNKSPAATPTNAEPPTKPISAKLTKEQQELLTIISSKDPKAIEAYFQEKIYGKKPLSVIPEGNEGNKSEIPVKAGSQPTRPIMPNRAPPPRPVSPQPASNQRPAPPNRLAPKRPTPSPTNKTELPFSPTNIPAKDSIPPPPPMDDSTPPPPPSPVIPKRHPIPKTAQPTSPNKTPTSPPSAHQKPVPAKPVAPVQPKIPAQQPIKAIQPLALRWKENSCHFHSVLNALLSVPELRQQLAQIPQYIPYQPQPNRTQKENKQAEAAYNTNFKNLCDLRKALKELVDAKDGAQLSDKSMAIRKLMFERKMSPEFNANNMNDQHDASAALIIMSEIFGLDFKSFSIRETDEIPGRIFQSYVAKTSHLMLEFDPNEVVGPSQKVTLQKLVNSFSSQKAGGDGLILIPEGGKIIDSEKAKLFKQPLDVELKPKQHFVKDQVQDLPDILTLQLKRFNVIQGELSKINNPVDLGNGIVDLSSILDTKTAQKYEVVSQVIHNGDMGGGHYTANVKIKAKDANGNEVDKFYKVDDNTSNPSKEISQQEFLSEQQSYILVLKKIKTN